VWLVTERAGDRLVFRGDSDAHIVARSRCDPAAALFRADTSGNLAFDPKAAFARLGLAGALSQRRSNGLFSMVERIRRDASLV